MTHPLSTPATRLRPALIAGGGVTAALLVLAAMSMAVGAISSIAYSLGRLGVGSLENVANSWGVDWLMAQVATMMLPAGLGVFLTFWLFWPIREDRDIVSAVLRSLLAALVALALVAIASLTGALIQVLPLMVPPFDRGDAWGFASSLITAVGQAGHAVTSIVPLAVLAGLSLWIWQRRARLTESPVIG